MSTFSQSLVPIEILKQLYGLNISPVHFEGKLILKLLTFFQFTINKNTYNLVSIFISLNFTFWFVNYWLRKYLVEPRDAHYKGIDEQIRDLRFIGGILAIAVSLFLTWKNSGRYQRMKKAFDSFDLKFEATGNKINNQNFHKSVKITTVSTIIYWVVLITVFNLVCDIGKKACFQIWYYNMQPERFLLVVLLEEILILRALKMRFKEVNETLFNLHQNVAFVAHKPKYFWPEEYKSIAFSQRFYKLALCRELHYELCSLSQMYKETITYQTAANLLFNCIEIFLSLYVLIFGFDVEDTRENISLFINPSRCIPVIIEMSSSMIKMYCIIWYSTSMKAEVRQYYV